MRDTVSSSPAPASVTSPERRAVGRVAALVAGDIVSFLIFAAVGRGSHGEATGLAAGADVLRTAIPFTLGWFVVSPFVGAFRREQTATPLRMLARTELAWLAAWPVAMLLRRLFVNDGISPDRFAIFAVVVLVSNAIFLGLWRGCFALAQRLRRK